MYGPSIICRSISARKVPDRYGNEWQYNSRSDHHSKVSCWAILFDLLLTSAKLRRHVSTGEVTFGINHEMVDFKHNKPKSLDLVVCTPGDEWGSSRAPRTFAVYGRDTQIILDQEEQAQLASLPWLREGPVGSVRIALEAKACMTAHAKARPRLHDELASSYQTIHGANDSALASGFVMINSAPEFISSTSNNFSLTDREPVVNVHKQPRAVETILAQVAKIPRRTRDGEDGFDAIGVVVVHGRNDGTPFWVVQEPPAPPLNTSFHYTELINRLAAAYDAKY